MGLKFYMQQHRRWVSRAGSRTDFFHVFTQRGEKESGWRFWAWNSSSAGQSITL